MVFCLILMVLAITVAFFHYIQGIFSATISAVLTAVAAVVALGCYEQVAPLLFNIKFYDQAASISLVVVFALAYIIPRVLFDKFIPGNVRVPVLVDKVGAGVMGLIAGLLSTGIVAVAADALPFSATIGMYSRFDISDKQGQYQGVNGQMQDIVSSDVITTDKLDPNDPTQDHLWFHQDDLVAWLEKKVSDGGSLSVDHPFSSIHPDLMDELYGQRLGIQVGAKHTAISNDQNHAVDVKGVYTPSKPLALVDSEIPAMRGNPTPLPSPLTPDPDQIVVIVRMTFTGKDMADETDSLLRLSSGAVRLVTGEPDANVPFKNYYPVATLDARGVAVACKPDDFMIADMSTASQAIDFVYVVDRDHVFSGEENKIPFHLSSGSFIEFKRYGVVDLSGKLVDYGPTGPNAAKTGLIRKPAVLAIINKTEGSWSEGSAEAPSAGGLGASASGSGSTAGNPSSGGSNAQTPSPEEAATAGAGHVLGDSGLTYEDISVSNKLAEPINARTGDDAGPVQLANGVGGELIHRQWLRLTVGSDTTIAQLGTPIDDNIQALAVEPNTVLVQVHCSAPVTGSVNKMWAWGNRVSDFALADASGRTYKCVGAWATIQRGAEHYLVANYMNFDDKNHLQAIPQDKGRPLDVWLAFLVPAGTPISEIRFSASTAMDNLGFKAQ